MVDRNVLLKLELVEEVAVVDFGAQSRKLRQLDIRERRRLCI